MINKRNIRFVLLVLAMVIICAIPIEAATFRTVGVNKAKYGKFYVWRPYNTTFYIQKAGTNRIKTLSRKGYTLSGLTDGSTLYYSVLPGKYSGEVVLYRCNLNNGKQQKVANVKNSLHICGVYNGIVYGNRASNGRSSRVVYSYNLKTRRMNNILQNFFVEKANGRYLYGIRNNTKYRYDVVTKKLIKYNWKSLY